MRAGRARFPRAPLPAPTPSTTGRAAIYEIKNEFFTGSRQPEDRKSPHPTDLCPVLRTIRLRVKGRLVAVDQEILDLTLSSRADDRLGALQRERASLFEALELIATASERGLEREVRRHWLHTLLRQAPECVTPRGLRRLRHLIEGLG